MKSVSGKKLSVMILACLMLTLGILCVHPVSAQAKTVKTKNISIYTKFPAAMRTAKAVKKGTTTVRFKIGVVKFTAPKTKTYTFSFSNLQGAGTELESKIAYSFFFKNRSGNVLKVSTQYGKTKYLGLINSEVADMFQAQTGQRFYSDSKSVGAEMLQVKRKLKRGQTVYMLFYPADYESSATPHSIKLKIK